MTETSSKGITITFATRMVSITLRFKTHYKRIIFDMVYNKAFILKYGNSPLRFIFVIPRGIIFF